MKAQITELWDTGREIITAENDEMGENRPTCLADLKKFENVLVEKKTVMIDNYLVAVAFRKVNHPSGGGSLYIVEVDYYL